MPLVRGHVWRLHFGSWEHSGERIIKYGVILQEGAYFSTYNSVAVVLLSTRPAKPHYSDTTVVIPKGARAGKRDLRVDCSLVYTIPVADLMDYQYALPPEVMVEIDEALMLGLCLVDPDG